MLAALLLSAAAATATDLHLVAHTVSAHSGQRTDVPGAAYQERNLGAGLRAQITPSWSLQAGAYRNSYDRTSVYALADLTPLRAGPLHAGAFVGLATGYPYNSGKVGAAGGLVLRLQGTRASAVLRLVPKVSSKQSSHTAALELGWAL